MVYTSRNRFVSLDHYFNKRNKVLAAKLLKQGYRYHKLRKAFSKFHSRHSRLVTKYNQVPEIYKTTDVKGQIICRFIPLPVCLTTEL